MGKNYEIREKCIFCDTDLSEVFFKNDLQNYVGHYAIEINETDCISIPFNVCICKKCNTPQNKYLADPKEVYKINHADSTGSIMMGLHNENLDLITKYRSEITNIIEIGSSLGVLGDLILSKHNLEYNIIEPTYFGNRNNKNIYEDFYENVDDSEIDANTVVISHVFEHFYKPKMILEKISENKKIDNIFLVFPDLEYYVNNNILHVLNTEHTYYVDNDFLIKFFGLYNFEMIEQRKYKNHSILFYFKRKSLAEEKYFDFRNENFDLNLYFDKINKTVLYFNDIITSKNNTYIWPSSIHSLYLMIFGLKYESLNGFLDNSPLKIGKSMYGTFKKVESFNEKIKDKDLVLLINGGVFNQEVRQSLDDNNVEYYTNEKN